MTRPLLIAVLFLSLSSQALAENGVMGAAALSGLGQGLSNVAGTSSQMLSIYGASMLQRERAEQQLRRDQQLMQWQAERDARGLAMVIW